MNNDSLPGAKVQIRNIRTACGVLLAGVLVGTPACSGSIGSTGSSGDDPGNGAAGNGSDPGSGGSGANNPVDPNLPNLPNLPVDPNEPAPDCTPAAVTPAPVRRLSQTEYQASLRDLLPALAPIVPVIGKDTADQGFENRAINLNPTPLLVEQYGTSAVDAAIRAVGKLSAILPCTPTTATEGACGKQFITTFGARAFRRPLTTEETNAYTTFFEGRRAAYNFNGAVQLTIEVMLQSPQFLYRLEFGDTATASSGRVKLTPYETATRLSYLIWGSLPDDMLFAAAQSNQLDLPAEREAQARRLLADPRAKGMLVDFHREWLDFDRLDKEPKDPVTYPTYNDTLKAAIREESNRFVEDVMWQGAGTLSAFLTSAKTQVNAPLAALYGVPAPASGWAPVDLKANERAGFLTRANFLAGRAHKVVGSPPLRANFVLQRMLCQSLPPPPANANLSEPPSKPGTTNRQQFEARTAPAACTACHNSFGGLGYALENYDAIGKYRASDNGVPVDATGTFQVPGFDWQINGAIDLSTKVAASAGAQDCAATNWYAFAIGRAPGTDDQCRIVKLKQALTAAQGNIRELLVAIAASPEFAYRPPVQ